MKQILGILLFLCTSTILLAQRNCPSVIDLAQLQTQDPTRYQRFMNLETFTSKEKFGVADNCLQHCIGVMAPEEIKFSIL